MPEQASRNTDDIIHKDAGKSSDLGFTDQNSRLLFLEALDALKQEKAAKARLHDKPYYCYTLESKYRWENWASPRKPDGRPDHDKALTGDDLRDAIEVIDDLRFSSQAEKHESSQLYTNAS